MKCRLQNNPHGRGHKTHFIFGMKKSQVGRPKTENILYISCNGKFLECEILSVSKVDSNFFFRYPYKSVKEGKPSQIFSYFSRGDSVTIFKSLIVLLCPNEFMSKTTENKFCFLRKKKNL